MKTFTESDMVREPSTVLDACDQDGEVHIQRQNGSAYELKQVQAARSTIKKSPEKHPVETPPAKKIEFPDLVARRKRIFGDMMLSDEDTQKLFNMLRGE